MIIEERKIKILKYLSNHADMVQVLRFSASFDFGMNTNDRDGAIELLTNKGLIGSSTSHAWMLPAGREYLQNAEKAESEEIEKDIHNDPDYALLKYLYSKEESVDIHQLPKIFEENIGSGMVLIRKLHDLRNYIVNDSRGYKLSPNGRKYFEERKKQKDGVIEDISSPLFISYSRLDINSIRPLVGLVRSLKNGKIFFDESSLLTGQEWNPKIVSAIDKSKALLLLWTYNAATSEFVNKEWKYALAKGKIVFPVLLDKTPLPPELNILHSADLSPIMCWDK